MITFPNPSVTGVILAGGKARRMGGKDKGLIQYQHQPLIHYAIDALSLQVDQLIINANRNIDQYQALQYPVVVDSISGFNGPLVGMLSAMEYAQTDYILSVPCDCPTISTQLRQRMMESCLSSQSDVAVAYDGERLQPVFSLIPCRLKEDLKAFLEHGDRKIDLWLQQYKLAVVDFSDQPDTFVNINQTEDLRKSLPTATSSLPLLGFSAYSGTGKTTLLTQILPQLNKRGLKVAVIKHVHHQFDIDKPGKDSYKLRQAGAQQMLIASNKLMALIKAQTGEIDKPILSQLLPRLDQRELDLILVEGFKHEAIPKIELHRPVLDKPLLYPEDNNIIAIASDVELELKAPIKQLDLNDIDAITDFVQQHIKNWIAING